MSRITVVANRGEQPYSVCACGARGSVIEDAALGEPEAKFIAGPLNEPCTCPRCFTCQRLLDEQGRCETLDCVNLGLHIPIPD